MSESNSGKLFEIIHQTNQIILDLDHQGNIVTIDGKKPDPQIFPPNFFATLTEYETDDLNHQRDLLNQDPTHHRSITLTTIRDNLAIKWSLIPIYDSEFQQYHYSAVGLEIDKEFYQSSHDTLTGLYNRNYLTDYLTRLNSSRHPVSVLFFDADNLKKINDQGGHDAGDQYLKSIVEFLQNSLRPDDTLGRYGGDEFIAILEDITPETTQEIQARLSASLTKYNLNHPDNQIQFSLGSAYWIPGQNIFETVKTADQKMYAHKAFRKSPTNTPSTPNS